MQQLLTKIMCTRLQQVRSLILLSALFVCGAAAAESPVFSGTWVMQERKSLSGPDYGNVMPKQITVRQSAQEMVMEMTGLDETGKEATTTRTVQFDTPTETRTPSGRKKVAQLQWQAGQSALMFMTRFSVAGKDDELQSTVTDTWTLADDGATLIIVKAEQSTKNSNSPDENWSMRGEYALKKPGEVWG